MADGQRYVVKKMDLPEHYKCCCGKAPRRGHTFLFYPGRRAFKGAYVPLGVQVTRTNRILMNGHIYSPDLLTDSCTLVHEVDTLRLEDLTNAVPINYENDPPDAVVVAVVLGAKLVLHRVDDNLWRIDGSEVSIDDLVANVIPSWLAVNDASLTHLIPLRFIFVPLQELSHRPSVHPYHVAQDSNVAAASNHLNRRADDEFYSRFLPKLHDLASGRPDTGLCRRLLRILLCNC